MSIQKAMDPSSACVELDFEVVSGNKTNPSEPKKAEDKKLEIIRKIIVRHCGGSEYHFLFIPKKNAFEKVQEMVSWSMNRIYSRLEPPVAIYSGDDEDNNFDFEDEMASFEMMLMNIGDSLQKKMFLKLRGSLAIRQTDGVPIVSYPLNFGQFSDLIRSFENPTAFDTEKLRQYEKKMKEREIERERKRELRALASGRVIKKKDKVEERKLPIFFEMKARVPVELISTQKSK